MAQSAIIHNATRVIRRLTTDASPPAASDETVVVLAANVDMSQFTGNMGKLDAGNTPVQATLAEWQAAGMDENQLATQRQNRHDVAITRLTTLATACAAVSNDATITNTNVKNLAAALQDVANGLKNFFS